MGFIIGRQDGKLRGMPHVQRSCHLSLPGPESRLANNQVTCQDLLAYLLACLLAWYDLPKSPLIFIIIVVVITITIFEVRYDLPQTIEFCGR